MDRQMVSHRFFPLSSSPCLTSPRLVSCHVRPLSRELVRALVLVLSGGPSHLDSPTICRLSAHSCIACVLRAESPIEQILCPHGMECFPPEGTAGREGSSPFCPFLFLLERFAISPRGRSWRCPDDRPPRMLNSSPSTLGMFRRKAEKLRCD